MGRPKIKIIDDSQLEEAKEKPSHKKAEKAKSETTNEGRLSPNAASSRRGAEGDERTRGPELVEGPQGAVPPSRDAVSEQESGAADRNQKPDKQATPKKAQKPGKTKPRGKKYQEIAKDLDRTKAYPLNEAIETVKKLSYSKFNATLEAHINTSTTGIRGLVSLPFAQGKQLKILVFGDSGAIEGAISGSEDTIEAINIGKVDFDLVITTPAWMPKLAKVARILGPRGLMPNPKNGTITQDLKKTVEGFQSGKTEYKTESKAPVMHMALGKLNQPNEELIANIKTLLQTLGKSRVKKVTLSPTMGPGVKIDLTSL